jgi:hypothetical protein
MVPSRWALWYDTAMSRIPPEKKARFILRLSADRVAMLAGSVCSLVVMLLCFFYTGVTGVEVAIRVGTAFALTYAVMFLTVIMVQRATRHELAARPRQPHRPSAIGEAAQGGAPRAAGPGGTA